MEDMRHKYPFVLTTEDLPEYNILYVGQQKEDELHCYVFDIAPKKIEGKKRYFQGRVWVDDHDFQIVKTYGKPVPDFEHRPAMRSKREAIRRTCFPSSRLGGSRSTAYTGSRSTPRRMTNCTSRRKTCTSARS